MFTIGEGALYRPLFSGTGELLLLGALVGAALAFVLSAWLARD